MIMATDTDPGKDIGMDMNMGMDLNMNPATGHRHDKKPENFSEFHTVGILEGQNSPQ
jgi:hypothetical protein